MPDAYILGIESSCDETAAAVVRLGEEVHSNVVFSQIATHQPYGGVVPELASREHLRAIVPVVRKALADSGQTFQSIDAIAVTQGPGLAGALLVGISYAKALAFALDKPLIAVNHLEGHIHAVLLEERQKGNHKLNFPVLALVVSGGHTHLYLAKQSAQGWSYQNIGHTRDDAAGEAFDKVAKLLALGYPGGPMIEKLAAYGDPTAVSFPPAQLKHRDRNDRGSQESDQPRFDFSYSGIKTAVLRYVETRDLQRSIDARRKATLALTQPTVAGYLSHCDRQTLDLVASFQRAVWKSGQENPGRSAQPQCCESICDHGVAANNHLRQRFSGAHLWKACVYFPSNRFQRQRSDDRCRRLSSLSRRSSAPMDFLRKRVAGLRQDSAAL
jgi:N6-L-threonylcarbamoyladenine synthase